MNEEELNEMIIKCPACGIEGVAKSIMKEIEIPHFGKVLETTIQCPSCGFKHSDIIALEQNDPAKYVIEINKNTLSTRVVRSQSATVSIPEVGVKVEPGPKSEGYVTNIERINQEKERILLHLEAIKADCNALAMDVQKTLKLKDVVEEDSFVSFSATEDEEEEE